MLFKKSQSIKFLQPTMESFETIVGPATEVHGRLVANESLRIDGSVIGNIEARQGKNVSIALGRTGFVQGDIYAFRVLVAGRVEGNIYASERVELHEGAEVRGDITYGQLGIEHGAKLNGLMISRNGEEPEGVIDSSAAVFQANWAKIKSK
jgi:cytoskeletal protein CcmA (bactofilin family)